jgi:hypothetical protein
MTEETLRQLLARVHERLNTTGTIDPQTRDMLAAVMRDIEAALWRAGTEPIPPVATTAVSPDARVAAAQPRLEALAVRFEAEHPSVAELLRQLGALLGQAGI